MLLLLLIGDKMNRELERKLKETDQNDPSTWKLERETMTYHTNSGGMKVPVKLYYLDGSHQLIDTNPLTREED